VAKVGEGSRARIADEIIDKAKATFERLGLGALICIGGDGSLTTALQLQEAGIPCIGVPKTIDNDLEATAMTFGFDSAVAFVSEALDRLHTTATSHKRVMVIEVMGRHAGWIALYGGLAGGADIILIRRSLLIMRAWPKPCGSAPPTGASVRSWSWPKAPTPRIAVNSIGKPARENTSWAGLASRLPPSCLSHGQGDSLLRAWASSSAVAHRRPSIAFSVRASASMPSS
jgi:hypothetical protein